MRPLTRQARSEVAELRDLDLQLALQRARALRENIEDQLAAIDDAKIEFLFEVARLRGAQRVIENRERRTSPMRDFLDLGGLALADKSARVGRLELLRNRVGDFGARSLGEGLEFGERFLGRNFVARAELDSDQDRAFDVFERLTISVTQTKASSQQICRCSDSIKNSCLSRRRHKRWQLVRDDDHAQARVSSPNNRANNSYAATRRISSAISETASDTTRVESGNAISASSIRLSVAGTDAR